MMYSKYMYSAYIIHLQIILVILIVLININIIIIKYLIVVDMLIHVLDLTCSQVIWCWLQGWVSRTRRTSYGKDSISKVAPGYTGISCDNNKLWQQPRSLRQTLCWTVLVTHTNRPATLFVLWILVWLLGGSQWMGSLRSDSAPLDFVIQVARLTHNNQARLRRHGGLPSGLCCKDVWCQVAASDSGGFAAASAQE